MGRIFPFLTYWPALKPQGEWRSGREEGAEEPARHHLLSTCLGTREAEAEGLARRHLPAGTVADSMKATTSRLGAEAEIRPRFCWAFLISRKWRTIDLLPDAREYPGVVWNHLKTRLFPLHRRARSNI